MKFEFRYFRLLPLAAILPAFLGGATDRWSEGIILIVLGLFLCIRPPRWSPGPRFDLVLLALLLFSTAAFLPARWFGIPSWRTIGTTDYGLQLGSCVTPQPWLTLEAAVLLASGMAWFYYCLCARASRFYAASSAKTFCAGITLLAGISIVLYAARTRWPFWNASDVFGPFPNRNQMGDLLAIGSVLSIACLQNGLRHREKSWVLWAGSSAVLLVSLVLAYSRASIILFFAALIIWVICLASLRGSGLRMAVGAGGILILWSAFLFGGGETLRRFLPENAGGLAFAHDLRWSIQRDAWHLAQTSPFTGIGLGNFDSQFWLFHQALGSSDFHIIHPESDWLWFLIEMGWPALLLLLLACGLAVRWMLPSRTERGWRLRAAAMSCGFIFAAHGFVDVSAHRVGSAFAALFAISLAVGPRQQLVAAPFWLKSLFRSAGIAFFAVGAAWVAATCQHAIVPGPIGLIESKKQASHFNSIGDYAKTIEVATPALKWAPMDWELYYLKAAAEASGTSDFRAALADFNRARYLNPITPDLSFDEGIIWMRRRPGLALAAWQDALQRAGDSRAHFYSRMLESSADFPWLRACLRERAVGDSGLTLVFLDSANPREFKEELAGVLQEDPELSSFSPQEKQNLFKRWEERGDKPDLLARSANRESWLQAGWPVIAACHAAQGEYKEGYEMVLRYTHAPIVPAPLQSEPEDQLRRDLFINPRDFAKGYGLYATEIRLGAKEEALSTLEKLTAIDRCPPYFFSLKAALYAESNRWKEAWETLKLSGLLQPPK